MTTLYSQSYRHKHCKPPLRVAKFTNEVRIFMTDNGSRGGGRRSRRQILVDSESLLPLLGGNLGYDR